MKLIEKQFPISDVGEAKVELDSQLIVTAEVKVQVDIIKELEELSVKTSTPIDDKVVAYLKSFVAAANAALALKGK